MKKNAALLTAGALAASAFAIGMGTSAFSASDEERVEHVVVISGDTWSSVAGRCGSSVNDLLNANGARSTDVVRAGRVLHCVPEAAPPATPAPTTTAATTTKHDHEVTTSTNAAPTSPRRPSTAPDASTGAPAGAVFFEDFTTPVVGFDRFKQIVYNRDGVPSADTVFPGEHDHSCGAPATTQRTIRASVYTDYFYECTPTGGSKNAHWMTALGDISGYSIAAFCADTDLDEECDAFSRSTAKTIAFDVTMADMGGGRWWEVKIVPTTDDDLSVRRDLSSAGGGPAGEPIHEYPASAVVVGNGPMGSDPTMTSGGESRQASDGGWKRWCDMPVAEWNLAGPYCTDHSTRIPMTVTDNGDGTVTWAYGGPNYEIDGSFTQPGSFPETFKVVYADHAYTPNKADHRPRVGSYTTHWDNLSVGA